MLVFILLFQMPAEKPDGFKSIHRLQYEQHAETLKSGTVDTQSGLKKEQESKAKEIDRFRLTFGTILTGFIIFIMIVVLVWLRRWFYSSYR
ncbi:hypothetical protein J7J69_03885 [candidate division WOR-3 bacterium]|nr:hypothetical protein [candidate division WOR-3 bacterium]